MSAFKDDFLRGFRTIAPIIIAAIPIGVVFGAVAAGKGLSPLEAATMSALVFAGGSQFVAMDIWSHPASWSALGLAALLVNVRHVLMGASLARSMGAFRPWQKVLAFLTMADENWAMAESEARKRVLKPVFYLSLALPFYLNWVLSTLAGALLGQALGDPALIGLDFAFPAVFIVLVMSFWKGRSTAFVLISSAAAATATHHFIDGPWYIVTGALAGLCAAIVGLRTRASVRL